VVGLETPTASVRAGLYYDYAPVPAGGRNPRAFDYGFGAEVVSNTLPGGETRIILPELYAKARLGPFELMAGAPA
jgi:hypothetical protein